MYISNILKFDGVNRIILKDVEDISLNEIYSQWKSWVLTSYNAKYLPAFEYINDRITLINDWKIINI